MAGSAKLSLHVKNTFLHVEEEGRGEVKMNRSHSDPSLCSSSSQPASASDLEQTQGAHGKSEQIRSRIVFSSSQGTSQSQDSISHSSDSVAARQHKPIASAQDPSASLGSELHHLGKCRPCAWQWRLAAGCSNGSSCSFCHLCPEGAAKARKKEKMSQVKLERDPV